MKNMIKLWTDGLYENLWTVKVLKSCEKIMNLKHDGLYNIIKTEPDCSAHTIILNKKFTFNQDPPL
jgi:hypothetical protein